MANVNIRDVLSRLSDEKRRGWLLRGVPAAECESVAEHSSSMTLICETYAPSQFKAAAVELAAVHDVAEAVTGDIVPADNISKEEKLSREQLAYCFFESVDPKVGLRLKELWQEYERNQTESANFVHDVDKLQRLDQAFKYARRFPRLDFSDFKKDAGAIKNKQMFDDAQGVLQRWNAWECSSRKHKFIFVIGGPGVGKGTQCALAASALEATHISAGELLRAEQSRPNSRFQEFLAKSFALSIPVPPMLLMEILRSAIQDQPHDVVFLDGFPLTEQQLEEFEKEISITYGTISLDASNSTLTRRLQERARYSGRIDDESLKISRRVEAFSIRAGEMVRLLQERKNLFHRIDSEGSVDEIRHEFLQRALSIIRSMDTCIEH